MRASGAAVRAAAALCIADVIAGKALEQVLATRVLDTPDRDRPLLRELCYGTLRAFPRLDAILRGMLREPMRRRDTALRALALVGLYQLAATRIPPHAAVSATVEATGLLRQRRARGLLNALLRRYQREEQLLVDALPPAQRAAQPTWLWQALGEQWPRQREAIVAASNAHPPMSLRVNRLRVTREDAIRQLADAGIESRPGKLGADAIVLDRGVDVTRIPGFAAGTVSVQDESAQLAAPLLDPRPGERILDACAAPGGKTGHLLECAGGAAEVTAVDISPGRLQRVADNLRRLQFEATLLCADIAAPSEALRVRGPFDGILLDVPCSASGVIRRHPDIKLLRRHADIAGFAARQGALLDSAWSLLRPGGRLLYVTCSLLDAENAAVARDFLDRTDDAAERVLEIPGGERCATGWQLLPAADGGDGLYFALLERRDDPPGRGDATR